SSILRDTQLTLGIAGVENDADHVVITVFPDPSLPGPFPVGKHEYTRAALFSIPDTTETLSDLAIKDIALLSGVTLPSTISTPAYSVHIRALVRYPATTAGTDKPVSTVLPKYPLIIIAHGNHVRAGIARWDSLGGLEYLANHLASYGY